MQQHAAICNCTAGPAVQLLLMRQMAVARILGNTKAASICSTSNKFKTYMPALQLTTSLWPNLHVSWAYIPTYLFDSAWFVSHNSIHEMLQIKLRCCKMVQLIGAIRYKKSCKQIVDDTNCKCRIQAAQQQPSQGLAVPVDNTLQQPSFCRPSTALNSLIAAAST